MGGGARGEGRRGDDVGLKNAKFKVFRGNPTENVQLTVGYTNVEFQKELG